MIAPCAGLSVRPSATSRPSLMIRARAAASLSAKQPHSRSARVRFAAPLPGAGRVPNSNGVHQEGRGEDKTASSTQPLDVESKGLSR
jgi:hypothetical protein